jgi:hypothetical protein
MVTQLIQAVKKSGQEASLWAYAAWTLPFVALSGIVFEHFVGLDSWINVSIVIITTTFFSISVFWWWWALNKVVVILAAAKQNEDRFNDVIHELRKTRETIREIENNVGNR